MLFIASNILDRFTSNISATMFPSLLRVSRVNLKLNSALMSNLSK